MTQDELRLSHKDILKSYREALNTLQKSKKANEHTYRTPLENLLNAFKPSQEIRIIHEPKANIGEGDIRPDFKIYKQIDPKTSLSYNALQGFIECKTLNTDLDTIAKGKQIEKYLSTCPNILLTNYNRFILFSFKNIIGDITLFPYTLEAQHLYKLEEEQNTQDLVTDFQYLLNNFFNATQANIKNKKDLVEVLSTQSFYLSLKIREAYHLQKAINEAKEEVKGIKKELQNCQNSLQEAKEQQAPQNKIQFIEKTLQETQENLNIAIEIKNNAQKEAKKRGANREFFSFMERTFETFSNILAYPLSEEEFCDTLGQSVTYGLLVAHLENDLLTQELEDEQIDLIKLLPQEFKLLIEFIYFSMPSFTLPPSVSYATTNIRKAIVLIDKKSLSENMKKNIEQIAIYLYEDFLKAYDQLRGTEKRKEGGVYYTPQEVVGAIVTSLDSILQHNLNKPNGFLDPSVKVLDFATGTGSFLANTLELILQKEQKVFQNLAIKDQFLKNIYGFEISFVPYIVAHIKLLSILRQANFKDFSDTTKLQIFLTNTLNIERDRKYELKTPLLLLESQEKRAKDIKYQEELLVIMGNPPYNVKSKNTDPKLLTLLNDYKNGLNETNIQPLNDDYIKFLRFAQWKLLEQRTPKDLLDTTPLPFGAMGFITNNSFIWGNIHRKMRQYLYNAFDTIYILNLHGDNQKDPKNDKNVFDITIGVCISLFVKLPKTTEKINKELPPPIESSTTLL